MATSSQSRKPRVSVAGDWTRLAPLMVLSGLLQMGIAIGMSAADSLFIAHVGADRLPVVYAIMPVIMLVYIAGYTRLLSRKGIDFVLKLTVGVLVVGGVVWSTVLQREGDIPTEVLYAAKIYTSLWFIGLYSLLWNYVDGFFNLSDAKQAYGLIAGGAAVGAIIGGTLVTQLSALMGVGWLFMVWATSAAMAWPVIIWIERKVDRVPSEAEIGSTRKRTLRETFGLLLANRFVLVFTLLIFMTLVTATLCEFRSLSIFEEQVRTAEELASLFGHLYAGVNVFNLLITLVVFKFLVRYLGVRNIALVQPVAFLIVFGLLLLDGGMVAALAGFVVLQGLMTSIDYNNQNLLFNALPERGKQETRTVIEGICEPMATATAGVFLLLAQQGISADGLSMVGFVMAIACLALAVILRLDFAAAVVANIRRGWLDFSATTLAVRNEDKASVPTMNLEEILAAFSNRASTDTRLQALAELKRINDSSVLLELMQRVVAVTPQERRALETVLVGFGPRAVPAAVKVLREPRFPLAARSVAARVLRQVSLPHLEEMLPSLLELLIEQMYLLTARRHVLNLADNELPHLDGLRMVYRELPSMTLELALELMSVTGLLPGYESIIDALRSGTGKERGFALESIEQACGRKLFQRLRPFLEGHDDETILAAGRGREHSWDDDLVEVVELSIGAAFPLEASAALEAAIELNPDQTTRYFRDSLTGNKHPVVREAARILLKRRKTGEVTDLTRVERIVAVTKHAFFKSWGLRSLEFVADDLEMMPFEEGAVLVATGKPSGRVGFVTSGRLVARQEGRDTELAVPAVLGICQLELHHELRTQVVAAAAGEMVWMPAALLRSAVLTRPRTGLDLLRWSLAEQ